MPVPVQAVLITNPIREGAGDVGLVVLAELLEAALDEESELVVILPTPEVVHVSWQPRRGETKERERERERKREREREREKNNNKNKKGRGR